MKANIGLIRIFNRINLTTNFFKNSLTWQNYHQFINYSKSINSFMYSKNHKNKNKNKDKNNNKISINDVPQEMTLVKQSIEKLGDQQVEMSQIKGSVSVVNEVKGVKQQNGQLYVLMFTCNKCQTQQMRSFTKNAYHKGVVFIRCDGCQNVHLIADNLGWFADQPINVESMHKEGQVKRVHDPAIITKFLQKAFNQTENEKL